MKLTKTILCSILFVITPHIHAQNDHSDYFTAVILSDPHIAQSSGTSVTDMQSYVNNIINMGKSNGLHFQFATLPDYLPTADIVLCLGDMDQDSEKSGDNFKNAFAALNTAQIPFVTMVGNHDIVPDYWTGTNPDKGLTWGFNDGGSYCNDVALNLVTQQLSTAQNYGVENVKRFTDGTSHTQMQPFTFTFKGVRFYVGQTYWFQKPYSKPSMLSSATYYAPDGVISALETFVDSHTNEPSIWMQHYPLIAGSDNDRWWQDENDTGMSIAPSDATNYTTAEAKRNKLAEIIKKTKNPVHFSGHTHWYAENTYNGVKDYTVTATSTENCGVFLVLIHRTQGVVEVKRVNLWSHPTLSHCDEIEEVSAPKKDINAAIGHTVQSGEDVSILLGENLDFESTQGSADATFANMHTQPGWKTIFSGDANDTNKAYIFYTQQTNQNSGAPTYTSLRMRAKWQENTIREQIYKEVPLPSGNYTLTYFIKAPNQSWADDLNYIELNGERTSLKKTTGWSQQSMNINAIQPSVLKLSFGFIGGNGSNDCEVFVDDIKLVYNSHEDQAIIELRELLQEEISIAQALEIPTSEAEELVNRETVSTTELQEELQLLRLLEYQSLSQNDYENYVNLNVASEWTQTGGTGTTSGQHWDGSPTSSYMEQSGSNWASNTWTISYQRNLTLPKGKYVLKVACRSASEVSATIQANGISVSVPANGDTGYGINTTGETCYTADASYANNGVGRGWEWRYVVFYILKDQSVGISLDATTTTINQWVSYADATLLRRKFKRGDVNNDGLVTVTDVMAMVNNILGIPESPFILEAAEINDDGTISVSDIMSLVNIILGLE